MTEQMTTIWIRKQDREFLERLQNKMRKRSTWAVIESIINLIKYHKLEKELR